MVVARSGTRDRDLWTSLVGCDVRANRETDLMMQDKRKPLLWLVHSHPAEAADRKRQLELTGYRVVWERWSSPKIIAAKRTPPAAVVIDLSRTPSVGRDTAIAMRSHRALLTVPVVLVGGTLETVAAVKKFLPDAVASEWARIKTALSGAIRKQPPGARLLSVFAAYEATPLAAKLGIKAGGIVALRDAPRGIRAKLGELPSGVKLKIHGRSPRNLTMWFAHSHEALLREMKSMKQHAASGALWILWNKNADGKGAMKLTQLVVRKAGLDAGLVDFKITRIDDDWSGLRFTIRKRSQVVIPAE